ncbi:MAG: hypothetical protein RSH25_12935 [Bacteroides sp.]|uniref:hypothetical protein n=1 Tax=Bacteroides sp. TaxID=29523 RepID=UPI002FC78273
MNGILQFGSIINKETMESTINERVNMLFKNSGERSIRSYAIKIGVAPTTLNECIKGAEPRYSLLNSILNGNPSVSAEWLLVGKGNMTKHDLSDSAEIEELKNEIISLKAENKVLREIVGLGEKKESNTRTA